MTQEYIVGFAFRKQSVLLIRKLKPEWQVGYLNGIGGKIEINETAHQAMSREFEKETGVITSWQQWQRFCTTEARDSRVHFFATKFGDIKVKQMEAEQIGWYRIDENLPEKVIDNLRWLIPMASAKIPVYAAVVEISKEVRNP